MLFQNNHIQSQMLIKLYFQIFVFLRVITNQQCLSFVFNKTLVSKQQMKQKKLN